MDRYDRQLRLWGSIGQSHIETASVCVVSNDNSILLNEILKNLLLLGFQNFHIIKHRSSTSKCNNVSRFFNKEDLFKINDNVNLSLKENTFNSIDEFSTIELDDYDLCLIIDVNDKLFIRKLYELSESKPILNCYSKGLFGYLHLHLNEIHFIANKNEDFVRNDLRIYDLDWLSLKTFIQSLDINSTNLHEIPFVILLYKMLTDFMEKHNIKSVDSISIVQLKDHLYPFIKRLNDGNEYNDINLVQARRFIGLSLPNQDLKKHLISMVQLIEESCVNIENISANVNRNGATILTALYNYCLADSSSHPIPLTGSLPDMESNNEIYNRLLKIYQERANLDLVNFKKFINSSIELSDEFVDSVIPNLNQIGLIAPNTHGNFVNIMNDSSDINDLVLKNLLYFQFDVKHTISDAAIKKGFNLDSYSTISVISGIVVQEIIKLITHQYEPINNTIVYNGLTNSMNTMKI